MTHDRRDTAVLPPDSPVGPFLVGELVTSTTHESVYEASEPQLARSVLLHVATADAAPAFAADARRVAAVTHPNLMPVLAASTFDGGAYAATPDLNARSLRELLAGGSLTSPRAARIVRGVAAASEAFASANLRVPIDLDTVVVTSSAEGERGLLDPLRATPSAGTRLTVADPASTARELAELLDQIVEQPSDALRSAIDATRSGTLDRPSRLADALSAIATPAALEPRHRRGLAVVVGAGLAAIIVGVVLLVTQGSRKPHTAATAPTARVLARIPLGLSGGRDLATAVAITAKRIWVTTTQGRLLRIDPVANQLVGNGLALAGRKVYLSGIASSAGSLWVTDSKDVLLRVNPGTGHITGKLEVNSSSTTGFFYPVALHAAGGILWLPGTLAGDASKGGVLRVDPVRMRPIGKVLPGQPLPFVNIADAGHAWVVDLVNGAMTRVDAASSASRTVFVTPAPSDMSLDGNTVWVSDGAEGILTPVDAGSMRFTRAAVRTDGFPEEVAADGPDLWVLTSTGPRGAGTESVERIDASTGRRVGRAVPIPHAGREEEMVVARGSVWLLSDDALTRLAPTTPRPALAPAPAASSAHVLHTGPLAGGTWNASTFVAPLTLHVSSFAWVAELPTADSVTLQLASRPDVSASVTALSRVFATSSKIVPVGSPAHLLAVFRSNPHLSVSSVRHLTFDGHAAIEFTLSTRNPAVNFGACGPTPCVSLFPVQGGQVVLSPGTIGPTILMEIGGHVLGISESARSGDTQGLAEAASLVQTIHFKG